MKNKDIAATFEKIADLLELQGANPFRVRAYRNGARKIADLAEPLAEMVADDRPLTELAGIGKDLAAKIAELVETGRLAMLDELAEAVPPGLLGLTRIPGLGPKKAAVLHRELGIAALDQLRAACEAGQIRQLKGFGAKSEETILAGIGLAEQAGRRIYWRDAADIVTALEEHMRGAASIQQLEMAGSYRRRRETVGDLDMLVEAHDSAAVMDRLGEFAGIADVIARGDTKMSVRLEGGLQIDLRVVPAESFGAALQYFTGSKEHNVVLRGRAKQRDLKINEWGVFRLDQQGEEHYLGGSSEEEVYDLLDLPVFPPELREARREFEWAAEGGLPELIVEDDLVGDLHAHTDATDGKAPLEEMVAAARRRGHSYLAITDHSQRVAMARGLDARRLRSQWAAIDELNARLTDFVVLKGIECDILEDGRLDLADDVLAEADWVVASVHYGQNQSEQQITARIVGAIRHPAVAVIAHPTGRLLNRREPYAVDLPQVFRAAREYGKMLELNANPARLDLNDIHCAEAKLLGVPIVISSDAHSTEGLDVLRYGILQARRGGLTANDVANTRSLDALNKLRRERGRKSKA